MREGYVKITVPEKYNIKVGDEQGKTRKAAEGETVEVSMETIKADPHLATFVVGADKSVKKDFYTAATTESLKAALVEMKVPGVEKDTREDLIRTAREQGVPREKLVFGSPEKVLAKK